MCNIFLANATCNSSMSFWSINYCQKEVVCKKIYFSAEPPRTVNLIFNLLSMMRHCARKGIIQYAAFTLRQQFLPFFYVKSWSNFTPNGSFKICSSWRFQSTPYMLNLMKFWPRYLRLKTIDIFQKLISFHLFHCQFSLLFLHWI